MEKVNKEKIRFEKSKKFFVVLALLFFIIDPANSAEISAVNVKIHNNEIYVSTSLIPDRNFLDDLSNGISKEITFFIDLFRVWKIWPDEFVSGVRIIRILKSDTIKQEYIAKDIIGNIHKEKRFRDLNSMIEWAINIKDLRFLNVKDFESGEYFVKVTIESSIRKLPPVVGYLLFFIPEKEFRISKDSVPFRLGKGEDI